MEQLPATTGETTPVTTTKRKPAKKKPAVKAKAKVAAKPAKVVTPHFVIAPRETIFGTIRKCLAKRFKDETIIQTVSKKFPNSKFAGDLSTAKSHLSWYKWKMKTRGELSADGKTVLKAA